MHLRSKQTLAVLATLSLALVACGDDDTPAASTPVSEETDAPSEATDAVAMTEAPGESAAPDGGGEAAAPGDRPKIVVGVQDFGESAVLGEVYGQALAEAGYEVEQQPLGGYRDLVFTTFESGDINFTIEYAASMVDHLVPGTATSDIDETATALRAELEPKDLVALDPAPAANSNTFVVTSDTAAALESPTVSALTEDMKLGAPPECPENPSCIPGLQEVYGIDLSAGFVPLDGGGPLTKAALEGDEIDVAVLFSSDPTIADMGWVELEDDKMLINADNIIPVTTTEVADTYGDDFTALVNEVSAALTTEDLAEMNRRFSVDKADASEVATEWLEAEGLLG